MMRIEGVTARSCLGLVMSQDAIPLPGSHLAIVQPIYNRRSTYYAICSTYAIYVAVQMMKFRGISPFTGWLHIVYHSLPVCVGGQSSS